MGKCTPLLYVCALLLFRVPLARPFLVGSGSRLQAGKPNCYHHGRRHACSRATTKSMKMSTPSTPVPRNIKDTVSCLRAAVQVWLCPVLLGKGCYDTLWSMFVLDHAQEFPVQLPCRTADTPNGLSTGCSGSTDPKAWTERQRQLYLWHNLRRCLSPRVLLHRAARKADREADGVYQIPPL